MTTFSRRILILPLLLCVLASGCTKSAPTSYYLLDSGEPPFNAEDLPRRSLRLADVSLPDYLDRKDIVLRRTGVTRLDVATVHQWAEPLDKGIRRVLREILAPRLARVGHALLPEGENSDSAPSLMVDIQRFDGDFNGDARLLALWQLRGAGGGILAQGSHAESLPAGADYASLTQAQSVLARRLGERLAERCARALPDEAARRKGDASRADES